MNRLEWIIKEIYRDGRKNFKWILKGVAITLIMIAVIKILIAFDMRDWFLPIVAVVVPVGMLYHWYSMSYDQEQKKILKDLENGQDD
tara:strand:- start:37 stop:297 length:261 start_codon:yes stop_codon:yes gene_type:complete